MPRDLGGRFAPIIGATAIDEAQRLRYCGGWLWRDGDAELVDRLRIEAEGSGVACQVHVTDGEIEPETTERVLTASLEDGHLFLEIPNELVDVPVEVVLALDIGVVGETRHARTPSEEEMHRWAEGMLAGLSFPLVREALLGCGLGRPNPQIFLALPERPRFLRIERGTRFPALIAETGPQALDGLLHFLDHLLAELPVGRALPEVTRFWEEGGIEPVLRYRIEERENRLSWLRAWLGMDRTD